MQETYNKLKKIMNKTHDINYDWVAREVGVSKRSIQRWVAGETQPHPVFYMKLKEIVERLYDLTFNDNCQTCH